MNKSVRSIVVILLVMAAMIVSAGCGPKKPTADDAKDYVKAVLDVMCTGDYDHSVTLADIEEGKETEVRDEAIQAVLDSMEFKDQLSEEVKANLSDCMVNAFSKAKYEVKDAVETEDGGYDVTVTIEPLDLFAPLGGPEMEILQERLMENAGQLLLMSEDEMMNSMFTLMIDMLNEGLENPQYTEPVDVTVHYGLLDEENNLYGCDEAEGKKLGEKIFYVAEN